MKLNAIIFIVLLGFFIVGSTNAEQGEEVFWYEVTINHGGKPFEFYGSSRLDNKAIVKQLSSDGYLRLDNLMYRQQLENKMIYKSWKEWDALKKDYIYLNKNFVISVHPLIGKPKE